MVRRFRTDTTFRLGVLSNVVRGGPYELFLNLLTVLVAGEDASKDRGAEKKEGEGGSPAGVSREHGVKDLGDEATLRADPEALAPLLDGHGADGHTLAHWSAKRGDEPRFLSFLVDVSHVGARLLLDLHAPSRDAVRSYQIHDLMFQTCMSSRVPSISNPSPH